MASLKLNLHKKYWTWYENVELIANTFLSLQRGLHHQSVSSHPILGIYITHSLHTMSCALSMSKYHTKYHELITHIVMCIFHEQISYQAILYVPCMRTLQKQQQLVVVFPQVDGIVDAEKGCAVPRVFFPAIFLVEAHHWSGCQTINYSIMQAPPVTNCPIQEKTGWLGFLKQHGNPIYQRI